MSYTFEESQNFLKRAEQSIPLGSQTFSKSRVQFPYGVSPFFIEKGLGSHVWDVDGNQYIDFVNGLLSISIGYGDPEICQAITHQLQNGISFSLPHRLETEVAELIIELVPCAEQVRFGKNGSDATSAAIRLARAFTKKDHIAVCGYHGWQDWYIGTTTKDLGIPESTKKLSHTFTYNDLDSLHTLFKEHPGEIAAVIMEPMNVEFPKPGFLESVQELAKAHGALFIFDEVITGFRFARGGCQELFNITPDLVACGKGLANGLPISAVAGRADIMSLMSEVFISSTFGGETLSLAACKTVLEKVKRGEVVEKLRSTGERLISGLQPILSGSPLKDSLQLKGHPSWSFFLMSEIKDYTPFELKTYFMQEAFQNGILSFGTHNISCAHSESDIDQLLNFYQKFIAQLEEVTNKGTLREQVKGETLKPLFKVR